MALPLKDKQKGLDALAAQFEKSFGKNAAVRGGLQKALKAIPTGSLALDYELGTGGWPLGYLSGVFGPRDIGKSSMIGLNAVRNAQAMDLTAAWVAYEPFDEDWAERNGVNVEDLFLTYPASGEEAFAGLHMALKSGVIDLVVFDSIGSILSEKETDDDGKPKVGGQAGLITWGVKNAAQLAYRNDVAVILLNQVRHVMNAAGGRGVLYQQPGGEALEHMESIIVQLKRGQNRYTIKQNGTDVQIGQEIVAHIVRNKCNEGTGHKAIFDYFFSTADGHELGIDEFTDVINTAKRTGVIKQAGAYYDLPDGTRHQGQKKVNEYLEEHPEVIDQIREGVLQAMLERNARTVLPDAEAEEEVGEVS